MTAEKAFVGFFQRGIRLSVEGDKLKFKAETEGIVTAKDIAVMKEMKSDLIDVVMEFEERAGIYEFEGDLTRPEAERLAVGDLVDDVRKVRAK